MCIMDANVSSKVKSHQYIYHEINHCVNMHTSPLKSLFTVDYIVHVVQIEILLKYK
jgi:hypothetical protein